METNGLEEVVGYLLSENYEPVAVRSYPELEDARYHVYAHPDERRPRIGFPEVNGRVLTRHFERIIAVVEIHEEFGDSGTKE